MATLHDILEPGSLENTGCIDWLQDLQHSCRRKLRNLLLPTRKTEDWRYLRLSGITERPFSLSPRPAPATCVSAPADDLVVDLCAGHCVRLPDLLPSGLNILPFSAATEVQRRLIRASLLSTDAGGAPFAALHAAALPEGLLIDLAPGSRLQQTLRIRHLAPGEGHAGFHYLLVCCGENASGKLVEEQIRANQEAVAGEDFLHVRTGIRIASGGTLRHLGLQVGSDPGWRIGTLEVEQAEHSDYHFRQFSSGSLLRRNDISIRLCGEGANIDIRGACMATRREQLANFVNIQHDEPGGSSHAVFNGLANGHGRVVFSGRILIDRDAQRSSAKLHSPNLLLSSDAEIDTKPILEIYADDVRCAHGATVGQLDPEALFYLQSRGLSETSARRMLALGFVGELLADVEQEGDRAAAYQCFAQNI